MKKTFLVAAAVLVGSVALAQKNEVKAAEKALKANKIADAVTAIDAAYGLVGNADNKTKAKLYFLKGKIYQQKAQASKDDAAYETAVKSFQDLIAFEKETGKAKYSSEAKPILTNISADLVNAAVAANGAKNFDDAAKKLYMAYQLDKSQEDYLYFAANSAVNGKDYDTALKYYLELKELGYTGVKTQYFATEVASGTEQELDETTWKFYKKSKDYKDFRTAQSDSRLPEIVKNIALIYSDQGNIDKAIEAVKEARAANPDDMDLLLTEANFYIKVDQKDKFKALMEEAIQKDPNNPTLYFNLGVITADQGDSAKAKELYEKTVELDPNYSAAYLNMAALLLGGEGKIVDEMNSLGTSRADNAKYETLRKKRETLYRDAVPYLEKVLELKPKDIDATKTLMNIYGTLDNIEKFREMKSKLATLEGGE
ncbi:tetratricopeptide repeat protein [Spongiivirga sp. MCCC 1A20706]|uniref:tetratricopeptide repeat protein n=1 Tax=Spongiivirga sp. MCCC 1A20706 TaxID=3160963 RepID=UPI00397792D9